MPKPDYCLELHLHAQGFAHVAGIDEAGRGPLAGPVVAAAVILDPMHIPAGLDDSKRLSATSRARLYDLIMAQALAIGLAFVPHDVIDRINIRAATLLAMRRACASLSHTPDFVLIDGRDVPQNLPCPARALTGGDGISASIAAASIIAKVSRDRLMLALHEQVPCYGFQSHMGYGTKAHRKAIAMHGASPFHRLSFAPLRLAKT